MDKYTWRYLLVGALLSCLLITNIACQGYSTEQYKALQTELDTTKAELTAVKAELSKTKDDLNGARAETDSLKAKVSKMTEVFSSLKPEIELAQLILDNFALGFASKSDAGIKITEMESITKRMEQTEKLKALQTQINNPKLTSALTNWWYSSEGPMKYTGIFEGFSLLSTLISTSMKDMSQSIGLTP